MRCSARSTFPAVERFVNSNKKEDVIFIKPTHKSLQKVRLLNKVKVACGPFGALNG
jgi:hypothetical protein